MSKIDVIKLLELQKRVENMPDCETKRKLLEGIEKKKVNKLVKK